MSIGFFKDACLQALAARADDATNRAINMRIRPASHDTPPMTSDEYALLQTDTLSEARAFAAAAKIVKAEYEKLVKVENVVELDPSAKKGSIYG